MSVLIKLTPSRSAVRPGDGFVTDPSVVSMGVSDATPFFTALLNTTFYSQVRGARARAGR